MEDEKVEQENLKLFSQFFSENWTLVVDSVSSARTRLSGALVELGAKQHKIILASTFEEAKELIKSKKPKIVLADYQLGTRSGLDLLMDQRMEHPESRECLFILVTGNTSQSAVASAAEEDVDAFILKPYTPNLFRKMLVSSAVTKMRPNDYTLKIEEGKKLLYGGNPEQAIPFFVEAEKLHPKPSLALFYKGQAEQMRKALDAAQKDYGEGLQHQKIHYKCLVGLFDLLEKQKRYDEAYDVVKRVVQYFPANPKRLSSVLRLAVVTRNYEDIEGYYRIFKNIDTRSDELVRYVCSALSVTGKYYLKAKSKSRALELFESAAVTCAGRGNFLRFIIETLVEFRLPKDAEKILQRFPAEDGTKSDFLISQFLIKDALGSALEGLHEGRTLIAQGLEDPTLYRIVIQRALEAGKPEMAEGWISKACQLWPDRAGEFKPVGSA